MALTQEELLALDIKIRGVQRALSDLRKITRQTKQTARESTAAGTKSRDAFEQARLGVAKLRNATTLTTFAISATVVAVDRLAKRAEKLRQVSTAFATLTARVNEYAGAFLEGMRRASDGFVRDAELMRQANNALILGLPVTAESMEELTDIAIRLGRAMGRDATESIESMVTGIGRQSRQMLDNLGIIVSVDEAVRKYAKAHDISVDSMTQAQRNLAFYIETLEKGRQKVKGVGDEVVTFGTIWTQTVTTIGNAIDQIIDYINRLPSAGRTGTSFGERVQAALGVDLKTAIAARRAQGQSRKEILESIQEEVWLHEQNLKITNERVERNKKDREAYLEFMALVEAAEGRIHKLRVDTEIKPLIPPRALSFLHETPPLRIREPFADPFAAAQGGRDPFFAFAEQMVQQAEMVAESEQNLFNVRLDYAQSWSVESENLLIEQLNREYEQRIAQANLIGADTTAIMRAWEIEATNLVREHEEMRLQKRLQVLGMFAGAMGQLFEGNKAFAIAETYINTVAAAMRAIKDLGPIAGTIAAAAITARGMAAIKNIQQARPGSAGELSAGNIPIGTQTTPTPQAGAVGTVEIHVFIEGNVIGMTDEELARHIGEEYARQAGLGGVIVGGFSDG